MGSSEWGVSYAKPAQHLAAFCVSWDDTFGSSLI